MNEPTAPKKRGRPPTGKALTQAERNERRRARVVARGARIITTTLTPEAAEALDDLTADGTRIDTAVSDALVTSRRRRKRHTRALAGTDGHK